MLVNAKDILNDAKTNKYAVIQFNINNLEWTKYILEECNSLHFPVILGVSEGAVKYMGGFNTVSMMVQGLIKDLDIVIPVCLHLDHGKSFSSCVSAIEAGFGSVMIDASRLPISENISITKKVVEYAHPKGVSVEAEVGPIYTNFVESNEPLYASVDDSILLVSSTGVDSLAPALGSVHGLYNGQANLNFDRMREISIKTGVPLVLHGGTGISNEDLLRAVECGTCKININTELQVAWASEVRSYLNLNNDVYDPRKIISSGEETIKRIVREKVRILSNI